MTAVSDLGAMDRTALGQLWLHLGGGAVPAHMSQVIQRRFLAYAIQARDQGDVSARAITGTRWSGPRFFGLTDKSGQASAGEQTPPAKPPHP